MHTDEAVHAVKFGALLEDGVYRYDNSEYHGPTLNYFTLIPAWAESARQLSEVDETTLRIVPVAFGTGILLLLPLLASGLGRPGVVCAAILTAVSPAMVFYSRYYIQETLLVFFTFAALVCGYRYARSRRFGWALATGFALGLMHATKETSLLAAAAMVLALGLTLGMSGSRSKRRDAAPRTKLVWHALGATATAAAVSALFYSSFFTHPAGIVDSYTAIPNYLERAQHEWHVHPWHYYLQMLLFFRIPTGPIWTEALILALAGYAVVMIGLRRRPRKEGAQRGGVERLGVDPELVRFLSFYSIGLFALYSAIPYKTPWNLLSPLQGLILLAGVGAASLLGAPRTVLGTAAIAGLLLLGAGHLAYQSYRGNHDYYADPANPYVYAHPTDDVVRTAERIRELASAHPAGNEMYIEVVAPGDDYWPLPWYLRAFPNTGWWDHVDMSAPAAPVILAAPSVEEDVLEKLYERPPPGEKFLYLPLFESSIYLRPTIELHGYVARELWGSYLRQDDSAPSDPNDG